MRRQRAHIASEAWLPREMLAGRDAENRERSGNTELAGIFGRRFGQKTFKNGGRTRDRTLDLSRVKGTLSRYMTLKIRSFQRRRKVLGAFWASALLLFKERRVALSDRLFWTMVGGAKTLL